VTTILYVAIGCFIAGLASGWYFGGLHGKAQLEALQASQFKALADAYVEQKKAAQAKQQALEAENETLKDNQLKFPDVAVRVCRIAAALPEAGHPGQVLPAAAGVLPPSDPPDRDIGPALFALADEADAIVAKCRAL
jgi:hypothetical protein